ncbi:hypothetical protein, partial [Chryseobacterium sp. EO14]|uniref:hypothetical protein n=1 Tax=Chryseobacterium sp. EO14 TaxID=2950551 RepID=UPI00210F01D0
MLFAVFFTILSFQRKRNLKKFLRKKQNNLNFSYTHTLKHSNPPTLKLSNSIRSFIALSALAISLVSGGGGGGGA